MTVVSFERMHMKSRRVREFFVLLVALVLGYGVGLILYLGHPARSDSMAAAHFAMSWKLGLTALMLAVFMTLLEWHILRTLILAFCLLALAYLFCAVVVLQFDSRLAHVAGLGGLAILFAALFITRSNLLIYVRDRTYIDAAIETVVAAAFLLGIGTMIIATLRAA
jgi:hypothetical protein